MLTLRRCKRRLTYGEKQLIYSVFQDAVDCSRVRVISGRFLPFQHAFTAMSPNGRIYFPKKSLYCSDFSQQSLLQQALFIHEITHVWQHQLGYPVWRCGLWLALMGGYRKHAAYRYHHLLATASGFADLNMEQQAALLEHYFICHKQGIRVDANVQRLLVDFLCQPNDKLLLPNNMRF